MSTLLYELLMESGAFFNPRGDLRIHRTELPHWNQAGVLTFLTWHLADSLPETLLAPWRMQRNTWMFRHPRPWSAEIEAEYAQRFDGQIEQWLDAGHGACVLRDPRVRRAMLEVITAGDPDKCSLHACVVMPNHVHVLVEPKSGITAMTLVKTWKGVSARRINQVLGRSGPLWQREYWDRLIRDEVHLARVKRYIANNPSKAGLPASDYTLWQRGA